MNLIIVESPTKAKTLSRFLGKDFVIEATLGHIKDLPKSQLGIDIEKNFKPEYIEVAKREKVVKSIKSKAAKAGDIFIATDPDREGEAIASHVEEVISEKGKEKNKIKRIVFHEITEEAVKKAIGKPKAVDKHLVDAQIARRVLDRLVGYKLSPLLWKKVRRGLSAGRVQSVTVRLIVEKEREIEAFKPKEYWEIFSLVKKNKEEGEFLLKLISLNNKKLEVKTKEEAKKVVRDLEKGKYQVSDIRQKEMSKSPYPPFTTSTLTQAASRLFFWSAKKTMSLAQKLYEEGLITYHRTDSLNISSQAISMAREYIKKNFDERYLPDSPRYYKTKAKTAQEAHEAIRPTRLRVKFKGKKDKLIKDQEKLYALIWKRFVACQMAPAVYRQIDIDVLSKMESLNYLLRATGLSCQFAGWQILDGEKGQNGEVSLLLQLKKGDALQLLKVTSEQKFTLPPARYTEASLIKTLEQLGIGRPSTYAPIISTIQNRNYVEKKEGKFFPTLVGIAVNDFLLANFKGTFEYSFTAKMEDSLDDVAKGDVVWTGVIADFWKPFEKILNMVEKKAKRVKIETEKLGKKCPECKKGELVIRLGRFGKFISCSRFPDCKYTQKYVEKIDMKCPECKKGDVIIKITAKKRKFFGCSRYPKCKWASWQKPEIKKPGQ